MPSAMAFIEDRAMVSSASSRERSTIPMTSVASAAMIVMATSNSMSVNPRPRAGYDPSGLEGRCLSEKSKEKVT